MIELIGGATLSIILVCVLVAILRDVPDKEDRPYVPLLGQGLSLDWKACPQCEKVGKVIAKYGTASGKGIPVYMEMTCDNCSYIWLVEIETYRLRDGIRWGSDEETD